MQRNIINKNIYKKIRAKSQLPAIPLHKNEWSFFLRIIILTWEPFVNNILKKINDDFIVSLST
jgi:hypothetical protein